LVFKNTKQFRLLHRAWASLVLVGSISTEEIHALSGRKESHAKYWSDVVIYHLKE
jgi:hypothetical protein